MACETLPNLPTEIEIDLTPDQIMQIAPYMERAAQQAAKGRPSMVAAQILGAHMRVGYVSHETAKALGKRDTKGRYLKIKPKSPDTDAAGGTHGL